MTERQISSAVVTGCTGVLGSALCRELAENGIKVYAVCRPGSSRIKNIPVHENITVIELDAGDIEKLPGILGGGADAFYHLAWGATLGGGRNDVDAQINNISMTISAVHAAKRLGSSVFIGAGSQAEYGRVSEPLRPDTPCFPENAYGMAKLCAGEMSRLECGKLGLDHIWIRVLSIYGCADHENTLVSTVMRDLADGVSPKLTAGEQTWDYLYADDAAEAFRLAAVRGKNGAVYPLGSGKPEKLRDYIETIRRIMHSDIVPGYGSIPYSEKQVMYLAADISSLTDDTGWLPETSFGDGIRKMLKKL